MERHGRLGDARKPADARTDHHPGPRLLVFRLEAETGIADGLRGGSHREDDEIIDATVFLGIHPLVGIEGAVRAVTASDIGRDARRKVGGVESGDLPCTRFRPEKARPSLLYAAGERGNHTQSSNDNAAHDLSG
jgi:hypothetical protein